MQPCITMIHNKYKQMTGVEKKIADYVLNNPEKVMNTGITELATLCEVAASAVTRFCKTLEYEGYREFRMALAIEVESSNKGQLLPAISPDDNVSAVFSKVFQSSVRTLQDTYSMLVPGLLEKVVEVLDEAQQIFFFGVGTSSTVAIDAQYRFMQLGRRANVSSDILYMRVAAMNVRKGDVVVGISHSGETKDTIETMRIAKENGAVTIVITSFKDSPITKYADYILNVYSDEQNYPMEAVSARMAHICLLDALMIALTVRHYNESTDHLKKRNTVLKDIRRR